MIHTIKPYGSLNINEVQYILQKLGRFYLIDKYGLWEIEEQTYYELQERGIVDYGRVRSNI